MGKSGKGWEEMEFYPWRGARRGLCRGRLADPLEGLMGELRVPGVGKTSREETRQDQGA